MYWALDLEDVSLHGFRLPAGVSPVYLAPEEQEAAKWLRTVLEKMECDEI